jgi:STE24 endopeptidase
MTASTYSVIDRDRKRRARRLENRKIAADLAIGAGEFASLFALVAGGMALDLRYWLAPLAFGSPIVHIALYLLVLGIFDEAMFFYPRYWRRYVLPRRENLLIQPLKKWLVDYAKEKCLEGALMLIVVEIVFAMMRHWPGAWWFLAGSAILLLCIAIAQAAPVWIYPLFYKFRPLEDKELLERIARLTKREELRIDRIEIVETSVKSRTANAAFAGMGRTRRILLSDVLLQRFAPDEIEAVVAHELGHYAYRHVVKRVAMQAAFVFGCLWVIDRILNAFSMSLGYAGPSDPASLPLMGIVSSGIAVALFPFLNGAIRHGERLADRYAVRTMGSPDALVHALERLASINLADPEPPAWIEWLFYSHPSISHRITACREYAKSFSNATP